MSILQRAGVLGAIVAVPLGIAGSATPCRGRALRMILLGRSLTPAA